MRRTLLLVLLTAVFVGCGRQPRPVPQDARPQASKEDAPNAIASNQDNPIVALEAAPIHVESAWGTSVNGLQAGIRCPAGKERLAFNEKVSLDIVIRNVSDRAVDFNHLDVIFTWDEKIAGTIDLRPLYCGIDTGKTIHIQPKQEHLVGQLNLPEPRFGPPRRLSPGKYRIGSSNIIYTNKANEEMGTGYLDFELRAMK